MIITNLLNEIKEQVANNEISACLKIRINLQGEKRIRAYCINIKNHNKNKWTTFGIFV